MIETKMTARISENPKFPKLMIDDSDGLIILATSQDSTNCQIAGTVIHLGNYKGDGLFLGTHQHQFSSNLFTDFFGEIHIKSS